MRTHILILLSFLLGTIGCSSKPSDKFELDEITFGYFVSDFRDGLFTGADNGMDDDIIIVETILLRAGGGIPGFIKLGGSDSLYFIVDDDEVEPDFMTDEFDLPLYFLPLKPWFSSLSASRRHSFSATSDTPNFEIRFERKNRGEDAIISTVTGELFNDIHITNDTIMHKMGEPLTLTWESESLPDNVGLIVTMYCPFLESGAAGEWTPHVDFSSNNHTASSFTVPGSAFVPTPEPSEDKPAETIPNCMSGYFDISLTKDVLITGEPMENIKLIMRRGDRVSFTMIE